MNWQFQVLHLLEVLCQFLRLCGFIIEFSKYYQNIFLFAVAEEQEVHSVEDPCRSKEEKS